MRFQPLILYSNQQVGSDQLGNPINDYVQIGESVGRFSSWTSEEIALDKRDVTVNNRKIITRASKADLLLAKKIRIEGLYHTVSDIKGDDTQRWRILIVSRYGSET